MFSFSSSPTLLKSSLNQFCCVPMPKLCSVMLSLLAVNDNIVNDHDKLTDWKTGKKNKTTQKNHHSIQTSSNILFTLLSPNCFSSHYYKLML